MEKNKTNNIYFNIAIKGGGETEEQNNLKVMNLLRRKVDIINLSLLDKFVFLISPPPSILSKSFRLFTSVAINVKIEIISLIELNSL